MSGMTSSDRAVRNAFSDTAYWACSSAHQDARFNGGENLPPAPATVIAATKQDENNQKDDQ
jgi:hypothetical protein